MNIIPHRYQSTIEVKRSKFITLIVPIAEFDGLQEQLRAEHPKANHVTYALRYLNEFDQIVENSSDDAEPKGSAGVPMLNVMRGEDIINSAVLIVRYFGGIKLGRGGMARAYADAVKMVISQSEISRYEKEFTLRYTTSYSSVQQIEYLLEQVGISISHREFESSSVEWEIVSTQMKLDEFRSRAGRAIGVRE